MYYDVIIAGGSASGLVCAINIKKTHPNMSALILEKLPRVGKKILSTGNGRCNLTNLQACNHPYRNKEFASSALNKYNPEKVIEFFRELGLLTFSDNEGRVYPRSNTATAVLDALRYEVTKLGIDVITECPVEKVEITNEGFKVNSSYSSKYFVIATGGKSSPPQGSDGSGFKLATKLGHKVTFLFPSLVPLTTDSDLIKQLKGIRAAGVKLTLDEKTTKGEILFTEYGVSGIAAMELASTAERLLYDAEKPILYIDLLPEMEKDELSKYIEKTVNEKAGQPMENLLMGILPKQLGIAILKKLQMFRGDGVIEVLSEKMVSMISDEIKNMEINITGTKGFLNSQVTSGGVFTGEIDEKTMQSKKVPGLYFCGEIIDVDGDCGGFNLQWAFASGLLAGELND